MGISRTGFADGLPQITYFADRVCVITTVKSSYAGNPYIDYRGGRIVPNAHLLSLLSL